MIKVITEDLDIKNDGVEFSVLVEGAYPKFLTETVKKSNVNG